MGFIKTGLVLGDGYSLIKAASKCVLQVHPCHSHTDIPLGPQLNTRSRSRSRGKVFNLLPKGSDMRPSNSTFLRTSGDWALRIVARWTSLMSNHPTLDTGPSLHKHNPSRPSRQGVQVQGPWTAHRHTMLHHRHSHSRLSCRWAQAQWRALLRTSRAHTERR